MKLSPVIILSALSLMLTSCLDRTKLDEETDYIRFAPVISEGTRAGEEVSGFPLDGNFTVWALSGAGDKYLDGAVCSYSASLGWTPIGNPKWPAGMSLRFVACSPENLSRAACDGNGVITLSGYTVDRVTDPLFTQLTPAHSFDDGATVGLPFYHALAKIDFRVLHALGDGVRVRVKRIEIGDVWMSGDFDSSAMPMWTPSGEKSVLSVYDGGNGTEVSAKTPVYVGDRRLVLPQSGESSISVTFSFSDDDGESWSTDESVTSVVSLKEWDVDRHYTYTLTIGAGQSGQSYVLKYTTGISSWDYVQQ